MSDEVIDALWLAMAEIFGPRFTSAFGEDPQGGGGRRWARALAGLDRRAIARGIEACTMARSDPWPPTLPEFRALCLGIPSLAYVRADSAAAPHDRDRFTVLVWQHIDGALYRTVSAERGERMLRDAYEVAREFVMRGGALPASPVGALAKDKGAPPVVAPLSRAEQARKDLGLSPAEAAHMDDEAAVQAAAAEPSTGKDAAAGPDA